MKVTTYSSPFDPALQAQQIDDAIAQKFDLFVVQIISQKAIIPVLTRVKAAKIPVVLIIAPMVGQEGQDLYVTYYSSDHRKVAKIATDALIEALKKGKRKDPKIGVISGSLAEGIAPIRLDVIKTELADISGRQDRGGRRCALEPCARRARGGPGAGAVRRPGRHRCHVRDERRARQCHRPGRRLRRHQVRHRQGSVDRDRRQLHGARHPRSQGRQDLCDRAGRSGAGGEELGQAWPREVLEGKKLPKEQYSPHVEITKANVAKYDKRCSY